MKIIRVLLNRSRQQFATDLGISARYVEAIESGDRKLTDTLIAEIMVRFGIDPESLKGKHCFPRSVLGPKKITVRCDDRYGATPDNPVEVTIPLDKFFADNKAKDKYAQLRVLMALWQQYAIHWQINHEGIEELFTLKLTLLLHAAAESNCYYSLAMRLDLVIDHLREVFQLQKGTNDHLPEALRLGKWTTDFHEWPSFFDALKNSFRPRPRSTSSRRKR